MRYSLELNKHNIPARNLLGLIYYEVVILQQHPVVRLRGVEHPLDILARHAAVCAAEHDNPVLTGGVYLDNGMSGRPKIIMG